MGLKLGRIFISDSSNANGFSLQISDNVFKVCHKRFRHVNDRRLSDMNEKELVDALVTFQNSCQLPNCEACCKVKLTILGINEESMLQLATL